MKRAIPIFQTQKPETKALALIPKVALHAKPKPKIKTKAKPKPAPATKWRVGKSGDGKVMAMYKTSGLTVGVACSGGTITKMRAHKNRYGDVTFEAAFYFD